MIYIKRIGIIIREFEENGIQFLGTRNDLVSWIETFNVELIAIPINISWEKIKHTLKLCDGIILSGGAKFHENDFKLIKHLYKKDIPTLGICLGMQSMALTFGDGAEMTIENHYSKERCVHEISITKDSQLYSILKQTEIRVNSRHHDCISNTNMKVSANSTDGIIEAVEMPNHKFFIGVEWHPESINDNNS